MNTYWNFSELLGKLGYEVSTIIRFWNTVIDFSKSVLSTKCYKWYKKSPHRKFLIVTLHDVIISLKWFWKFAIRMTVEISNLIDIFPMWTVHTKLNFLHFPGLLLFHISLFSKQSPSDLKRLALLWSVNLFNFTITVFKI